MEGRPQRRGGANFMGGVDSSLLDTMVELVYLNYNYLFQPLFHLQLARVCFVMFFGVKRVLFVCFILFMLY